MVMFDCDTEGFGLEFEPMPAGEYMCRATDKEETTSSTGKDSVIVRGMVVEGEYEGRTLPDRFFVLQGGGLGYFKRFCDAAKIPYKYDKAKGKFKFDTDDIPGAEFRAVLGQKETTREDVNTGERVPTGRMQNTIEEYLAV